MALVLRMDYRIVLVAVSKRVDDLILLATKIRETNVSGSGLFSKKFKKYDSLMINI